MSKAKALHKARAIKAKTAGATHKASKAGAIHAARLKARKSK